MYVYTFYNTYEQEQSWGYKIMYILKNYFDVIRSLKHFIDHHHKHDAFLMQFQFQFKYDIILI